MLEAGTGAGSADLRLPRRSALLGRRARRASSRAIVRGFSGFGAGLIFMPVAAACLGPKPAAGILYIIDTLLILPFVAQAVRRRRLA